MTRRVRKKHIDAARAALEQVPKRARLALQEILKKGFVTSRELQQLGYNHPPRAIADLREHGVPIDTLLYTEENTGRRLARYVLTAEVSGGARLAGRRAPPKKFREEVLSSHGHRCNICAQVFPPRLLQLDHRIPYRVGGEPQKRRAEDFQSLCAPHQRAKSFECESCPNWSKRSKSVCATCFWAHPDGDYSHIATRPERRVTVRWTGRETRSYDRALARFGDRAAMIRWIKSVLKAKEGA